MFVKHLNFHKFAENVDATAAVSVCQSWQFHGKSVVHENQGCYVRTLGTSINLTTATSDTRINSNFKYNKQQQQHEAQEKLFTIQRYCHTCSVFECHRTRVIWYSACSTRWISRILMKTTRTMWVQMKSGFSTCIQYEISLSDTRLTGHFW